MSQSAYRTKDLTVICVCALQAMPQSASMSYKFPNGTSMQAQEAQCLADICSGLHASVLLHNVISVSAVLTDACIKDTAVV